LASKTLRISDVKEKIKTKRQGKSVKFVGAKGAYACYTRAKLLGLDYKGKITFYETITEDKEMVFYLDKQRL
jgi:hypothetical protein